MKRDGQNPPGTVRGLQENVPPNEADVTVGFRRRSVLLTALLALASAAALAGASTAESSFPGANGKLVFTSPDGGLYVMDAAGGAPRKIPTPFWNTHPVWSPDGSRLAFSAPRARGSFGISVMDADGGGEKPLTSDPAVDGNPTWSPDGLRIAFSSNRLGPTYVHVMGANGSNPRAVGPPYSTTPDWSPDGSLIAFAAPSGLAVMRPDGTGVRNLTNHLDNDLYPSWSPDGRRLAYESDRDGTYEIWTINADGSGQSRLTSGSRFVCPQGGCSVPRFRPSWSPDGKQIAFTHDRDGVAQVYVMNADGTGQKRLTSHHMDAQDVSWQPAVDLVASTRAQKRGRSGRMGKVRISVRNASPLTAAAVSIRVSIKGPASIAFVRGARCSGGHVRTCRVAQLAGSSAVAIDLILRLRRAGRVTVSAVATSSRTEATPANNGTRGAITVTRRR
jgi:Tol biopolymer transport system component